MWWELKDQNEAGDAAAPSSAQISGQRAVDWSPPQKRDTLDPPDRLGEEEGGRAGARGGVLGPLR